MNLLTLEQLNLLHYTLLIAFGSSLFFLAIFQKKIKAQIIDDAIRLLGPVLFIVAIHLNGDNLTLFKGLMLSESLYYAFGILLLWIPHPKEHNRTLSLSFVIALSIFGLFILATPGWSGLKFLELRWLVILQVATIMVYALTNYLKKGDKEDYGALIFNAIGSVILTFMFTTDGLFFLLFFRMGFYISLLRQYTKAKNQFESLQADHLNALEKDFQDTVRKEVNHRIFYLELSKEKMAEVHKTDNLTGALTKKAMFDTLDKMTTSKEKQTFSILMFDIDKFKGINDTLGHIVGDKCLKILAQIARKSIRDHDHLCRYGGDEFLIILPDADLRTAVIVAERFRRNIEKTEDPHFTVSIGVANYPKDAQGTKDLLQHADDGLYLSKEKGRNQVSYLNKEARN